MTNQTQNKSFILHKDSLSVLNKLSDEQAGKLFKSIFIYQIENILPEDAFTSIIFEPFLNQFKRDEEKYQNVVERNKINIAKRWNKPNTKNTTGKIGIPKDTKNADKVNVTDKVTVIDKETDKETKKVFTPPVLDEIIKYFKENGYTEKSANTAYNYYNSANWKDSKGNKVKNWKQKMKIKDPLKEFWNKYINGDMLEREKLLEKMVKFPMWQELLKMPNICRKPTKKLSNLTLQEYCH